MIQSTKADDLPRLGRRALPQIFVNVTYVGGYDELAELERGGKLDTLLAEAYALVPAPGE
jgi:glutaredoxin 3